MGKETLPTGPTGGNGPENPHTKDIFTTFEAAGYQVRTFHNELIYRLYNLLVRRYEKGNYSKVKEKTLKNLFQGTYNEWKGKRGHELLEKDAKKIIDEVITEFIKRMNGMTNETRESYIIHIAKTMDIVIAGHSEPLKGIRFSESDLEDMITYNDIEKGKSIMESIINNPEKYQLDLRLAITLARLGVLDPGEERSQLDIPDFEGLSEIDKEFLCECSFKISEMRKDGGRTNRVAIDDEIIEHFGISESN